MLFTPCWLVLSSLSLVFVQVLENPTLLSNTRPAKPGSRSLGSSANTSSKGACC